MDAYGTELVLTDAGMYSIELHSDIDASNPLTEWDHEGMGFWVNYGDTRLIETDTLHDADDAAASVLREWVTQGHGQDEVLRRFNLWRAITGSSWLLVAGEDSSSQSDFYRWHALVDTAATYRASDGKEYPSLPDPAEAVQASMRDYRMWAAGEVVGYVVKAPDGEVVECLWGFYDDRDAIAEGTDAAKAHAGTRVKRANLAGAGFVGVV